MTRGRWMLAGFVIIMLAVAVLTMAAKCGDGSVRPDRHPATPAPTTSQFIGSSK